MKKDILLLLQGGNRRTIGQAGRVADMVSDDPKLFADLMAELWSVRYRTFYFGNVPRPREYFTQVRICL